MSELTILQLDLSHHCLEKYRLLMILYSRC